MSTHLLMARALRTCGRVQGFWRCRNEFLKHPHCPGKEVRFQSCCTHKGSQPSLPWFRTAPVSIASPLLLCKLQFGQNLEHEGRIITRREVSAAAGTRVGLKKTKRALGQSGTLTVKEPGWIEEEEEQITEKSKNQLKREASLALELAYDLAELSAKNLNQVARYASLSQNAAKRT